MKHADISKIKENICKKNGSAVILVSKNGRRGYVRKKGIIDGTYSDLFTVLTTEGRYSRRMCFTYTDVATNAVKLFEDTEEKTTIA